MSEWAVLNGGGLIATWSTPEGRQAETVIGAGDADEETLRWLAQVLTELSSVIWDVHLLPSFAPAGEPSRAELAEALSALLPAELSGFIAPAGPPSSLLESAADLGVELREVCERLSSPVFAAVRREVEQEIEALRRALGDRFSGRAAQALCAPRTSPSPGQVSTAAEILYRHPFVLVDLLSTVEPAAASVAAVEWFGAALRAVQSDYRYPHPVTVLIAADRMNELPMAILTSVADQLEAGIGASAVVEMMLNDAVLAQAGWAPPTLRPPSSPSRPRTWPRLGAEVSVVEPVRISTLTPGTAGPELLAALTRGINGCRDLYVADGVAGGRRDEEGLRDEFLERAREELADR